MDQKELVSRCKNGESGALNVLYQENNRKIYAMALRMTGSQADADDVVQDTFIRAFKYIKKFRGDSSVSTWLCRIAINLTRDLAKKQKRIKPEIEVDVAAPARDIMVQKKLEQALGVLPEGFREVLVMHDVVGMGHGEIATVLGVKEGTSKSQLHKARARMREILTGKKGKS